MINNQTGATFAMVSTGRSRNRCRRRHGGGVQQRRDVDLRHRRDASTSTVAFINSGSVDVQQGSLSLATATNSAMVTVLQQYDP